MKNRLSKILRLSSLGAIALLTLASCEREISDEAVPATFANTADIFTDAPVGLTDQFFESFDPAGGANTEGFGTDNSVAYAGTTSIRIDVPAPNDPNGGFIGGIFKDRGNGRNLTGYDALTFWAKGSTTASIGTVGFGVDFEESKYAVTANNVQLSTDWKKYIIPIPDPSKLIQERGMFIFSAGTESTDGAGYTFWIDELRFEKLGTNSLVYPFIMGGADITVDGFEGSNQVIRPLGAVYNLGNGLNQTVTVAPSYFNFTSSNTSVTGPFQLNNAGQMATQVIGTTGTAVVTAQLGSTLAQGSLTINAVGSFPHAPIPTHPAANVISLFSDAYNNIPVRHYNGFFEPFQTTQGGAGNDPFNVDIAAPFAGGGIDNIINYTQLNFVSIGTYEAVPLTNITGMTHLHVDINVRETIQAADFIRLTLESGTGTGSTSSGSYLANATILGNVDANGWASLDIPLTSFAGYSDPNIGQLLFISDATISDIWVDNVYFHN